MLKHNRCGKKWRGMDDVSLYPRENEGGPKVSTELTYLCLKPATNLKLGKGVFYWRTIASIGIAPFILSKSFVSSFNFTKFPSPGTTVPNVVRVPAALCTVYSCIS